MSAVFELDSDGWDKRLADARLSGFDANKALEPDFFDNAISATGQGIMRGGARTADAFATVGRMFSPPAATEQEEALREERMQAADELQADIRESAVNFWTPNAQETGTAGKVLGSFGEMVLPLAATAGNPGVLMGTQAIEGGKDLVDQGVDATTAATLGTAEAVATGVGFKLPFLGNNLAKKMAFGAGSNLLLGGGLALGERETLEARGYEELAKQYDPLDATSRSVDLLTGLAFGGVAHLQMPRMSPSQRNAAMAAGNAKHFQQDTAPGIPADAAASVAHTRAMETALEQMSRNEPVNVPPEVTEAAFVPRPARADAEEAWRDVFGEEMPKDTSMVTELPKMAEAVQPLSGESAVRNPISFDADPARKLAELKALTEKNVPVVQKIVEDLNARLAQTESKLNIKEDAKILEKAARPSILERKPWHGVEHIRDALRFKTVIDRIDQLPGIVDVLKEHGIGIEKIDTAKLMEPGQWGWRIVALDLRMPNGQLVEHYMPLRELELAKKNGGHQLFEKWRNRNVMELDATERAEYLADLKASRDLYQEAWEAAASRTGLDDTAALASLKSFEDSASSLTASKSLKSSPDTGTSVRQTPSTRTAATSGVKTTTVSGDSLNLKTDIANSSSDSLTDGAAESPVISAVKELLIQQDILVPTGEIDADGNLVVRSGRELMAESDAAIAKAQQDAAGIEAAVSCFLTRGVE